MSWAKLGNRTTGEIIVVDSHLARMARLRRRVLSWCAHVSADFSDVPHQTVMLTLTYRDADGWRPKHISEFMYWLRARWHLLAYCWVAELQKRGAVHYHVLAVPSIPYRRLKPDKMGGWEHGATKTEKARSPYYVAKYTQKGGQNEQGGIRFPKGLRILAAWSSRRDADSVQAGHFRVSTHPAWCRAIACSDGLPVDVRRASGGGFEIGGKLYRSEWAMIEVTREKPPS